MVEESSKLSSCHMEIEIVVNLVSTAGVHLAE